MSEEYLRYRIFENRVKEDSPGFIRWLNKVHPISIEEMIALGSWDVRFDCDRALTIECLNDIIKATKPYWKTAGVFVGKHGKGTLKVIQNER